MGERETSRVDHYAIAYVRGPDGFCDLCRCKSLDAALAILAALMREDNDGPTQVQVRKVPAVGI